MKRFMFFALVAVLVAALAAPAIAETKIGGSYTIRGIYWDQGLDNGRFNDAFRVAVANATGMGAADVDSGGIGRYFDNRLRLNIDSKVSDTLSVHVQADSGLGFNGANGDFQNPAATPDSYFGIWNKGGSFINNPEANASERGGKDIVFQQAYMDFTTPIGAFSLGRQWAFWGTGLLVGENRNRLAWSYQIPELQAGLGYDKFSEGDAFSKGDDQDNYFVWALATPMPNLQVGPYFEYSHSDALDLRDTVFNINGAFGPLMDVNTYGVSLFANLDLKPLTLSGEFAYRGGCADRVVGDDVDFAAYAAVARGTFALPVATLGVEGGYIRGQDATEGDDIQAFVTPYSFSPFAILGELAINGMDLLGNVSNLNSTSDFDSNMIYGKAFVQATPIQKLDTYLAVGYAAPERRNGRSNFGTEIDLSLTYAISPNLTYNFTGGYLFTGDFFKEAPISASTWFGNVDAEDAMLAVQSITVNF
ncbi:MAG: hypothetical protein V2A77_06240 [Pseudomonadota bacterium]